MARIVFAVFGILFAINSIAQTFPSKPLRIIVPFPAGGIVDLMARSMNEKLAAGLGQPVLVETRPGANASLGTEAAAKSDPDGHTIVLATLSHVTTPLLTKTPWHPTKDFAGVTGIISFDAKRNAEKSVVVVAIKDGRRVFVARKN